MSDSDNVVPMPARAVWAVPQGDGGDACLLLNFRSLISHTLTANCAEVTGTGFGMGEADIEFTSEGRRFMITIKVLHP